MKKTFGTKNNRALSTVISTILMIMVVMIGMTLLFAYVTVYAQGYKDGVGGAVMESLTIEDVWVKPDVASSTGYSVTVWIYNVGKVDSTVLAVYTDQGISLTNSDGEINLNIGINMNQHVKITLDCPSTLQWVKIVTQRGSEFESR